MLPLGLHHDPRQWHLCLYILLVFVQLQQEREKWIFLLIEIPPPFATKITVSLFPVPWTNIIINIIQVKPQKIWKKRKIYILGPRSYTDTWMYMCKTNIYIYMYLFKSNIRFLKEKMMLNGWTLQQLAYSLFPYFWKAPATQCGEICWHWQLLKEGFILHDVQGVEDIKVLGSESLVGPWVCLLQAASVM